MLDETTFYKSGAADSTIQTLLVRLTAAWDGGAPAGTLRGTIAIANPKTGECSDPIEAHRGLVRQMEWNAEGTRLATCGQDGTAAVWSERGEKLVAVADSKSTIIYVALNANGTRLLTGAQDGSTQVWDISNGRSLRSFESDGTGPVAFLAFSPDGRRVLVGAATTRIVEMEGMTAPLTLPDSTVAPLCGTFSPDGARVVTGSPDGSLNVHDAATGIRFCSIKTYDASPLTRLEFQGRSLLVESPVSPSKVWSATNRQDAFLCKRSGTFASELAFSADGSRLFAANEGGKRLVRDASSPTIREVMIERRVSAWDTNTGEATPAVNPPAEFVKNGFATSRDGRFRAFNLGSHMTLIDSKLEAANSNAWPSPDSSERVAYHLRRAQVAEFDRNGFSMRFHAERALRGDPTNPELKRILAAANGK